MAEAIKGGEGSGGEGRAGKESMASGGGSPEEVFTRPWDPFSKGTDPFDLEGRDEETLPLIDTTWDHDDTNPFVKGPWYESGYNPFLQDLWTPSFDPLVARDKVIDKFDATNPTFKVTINPSSDFTKTDRPAFVSDQPEALFEPSQS